MLKIPSHINIVTHKDIELQLVMTTENMPSKSSVIQELSPKCHFSKLFFLFGFAKIQEQQAVPALSMDKQAERIMPP